MVLKETFEGSYKGSIIVAHPGTQHSYETALAVQNAGLLRRYITGFYYKPSGPLGSAIRLLPGRLRSRADRELYRRYKDRLHPDRVQTLPILELLYVAARRLALSGKYTARVREWRNEWFDGVVSRIVTREKPPAVICYDASALKTFTKAKSFGIRCILDQSIAHIKAGLTLMREESHLHPDFDETIQLGIVNRLLERDTEQVAMADLILAGSNYVKKTFVEHGVEPGRIAVLPYGVDTERFHPVQRSGDSVFRLLFVGQIGRRKGIKYLLDAVKQLRLPQMELVLVGRAVGLEEGLAPYRDYFRYVPNLPYHEVHTCFQNADVFVYPSLHEGSAIAIYEALASGLPVITTLNSGSVVRDGIDGFIIPIRDVSALKEKILLLYNNRELRKEMGRTARKRAEQFTWEAYRQRLGVLLQDFLKDQERVSTKLGPEAEDPTCERLLA